MNKSLVPENQKISEGIMRVLIVYYSRSGKTRGFAEVIAEKLGAELEEIVDHRNRNGLFRFLSSGNEAYLKKVIPIERLEKDLSQYDLIIVGTPIWAGNLSSPVRSFLREYKEKFPRIAFFAICLGSDPQNIFLEAEEIVGKKPLALMHITRRDIKKQLDLELVDAFVKNIKQNLKDE